MADPLYSTRVHRDAVKYCRRVVDEGRGWCAEVVCLVEQDGGSRYIEPGSPVDAAHDRETGGYHGPAHPRCNRAEGARWMHQQRRPPPGGGSRRWKL